MERLMPGQLPTISLDPEYANPDYASGFHDVVTDVADNLNAARAQAEAAARSNVQTEQVKSALVGAGLAYLVIKFLL